MQSMYLNHNKIPQECLPVRIASVCGDAICVLKLYQTLCSIAKGNVDSSAFPFRDTNITNQWTVQGYWAMNKEMTAELFTHTCNTVPVKDYTRTDKDIIEMKD